MSNLETEEKSESIPFFVKKEKPIDKTDTFYFWIEDFDSTETSQWKFYYFDTKTKMLVKYQGHDETLSDKNRQDLMSLVKLFESKLFDSNTKKINIIVYTYSSYIYNCVNEWIDKWKRTNFVIEQTDKDTSAVKMRPNSDLLKKIEEYKSIFNLCIELPTKSEDGQIKMEHLCL